jgi:Alkylmercury lyase
VPTPHLVRIKGGPAVFSMCAVDALGIAAMLATPVTISSADPGTGTLITVAVPASGASAVWEPSGTVVFIGELASCGPAPDTVVPSVAADTCCGVINFFTGRTSARAWAAGRPEVTGRTLSQEDALAIGIQTFGHLLCTGP